MSEVRRLYRSRREAMLGGVCAGLARYASLDPTAVRLGTVLLCFVPPLCPAIVIGYVVAWIVVPRDPAESPPERDRPPRPGADDEGAPARPEPAASPAGGSRAGGGVILGSILVFVGLVLLAERLDVIDPWLFWRRVRDLWPLGLIGLGLALLVRGLAGRDR